MGGKWILPDFDADLAANLPWYRSQFRNAGPDQLVGEHSTVYLPSSKAPARIARLLPDARLVFLLRDPVARTWSHYWHRVRGGQTVHGFEATLRYAPHTLLTRSFYRRQNPRPFTSGFRSTHQGAHFRGIHPRAQRVTRFGRGVPGLHPHPGSERHRTHFHRGDAVRFARLQLLQNRLFRPLLTRHPAPRSARRAGRPPRPAGRGSRPSRPEPSRLNRGSAAMPPMRPGTREFLGGPLRPGKTRVSRSCSASKLERFWPSLRPGRGEGGVTEGNAHA